MDTEDLQRYHAGGIHPVHLGEVYNDLYEIVYKISYGGFGTVWLARDSRER